MTVLFSEATPEVEAILSRRRELGLDGRDEVWEGVYHVAPLEHFRNVRTAGRLRDLLAPQAAAAGLECVGPFNLGAPDDYRAPDMGLVSRAQVSELHLPTAAVVVEVLSPRDETFAKFGFHAAHDVDEVWVVDPLGRSVRIWQLRAGGGEYTETGRSGLLGLGAGTVERDLDWPAA